VIAVNYYAAAPPQRHYFRSLIARRALSSHAGEAEASCSLYCARLLTRQFNADS